MHSILIGKNLLSQEHTNALPSFAKLAIISGENIPSSYYTSLAASARSKGIDVHVLTVPEGEQNKTRQTKERLEDALIQHGFGKDSCLFAVGGGVITDLVGYLAATYCRGIPFLSFPTTLMAMVDASLGGKNGVNVPQAKNWIGTIYFPHKVVIDLLTLESLPQKECASGLVEMIKHGLIASEEHFDLLEKKGAALLNLDFDLLETAVRQSSAIKMRIVAEEETIPGKRHLLNFGHTIGHALETLSNYTLSHGEAVALGLIGEAYLSMKKGLFSEKPLERLIALLKRLGLSLKLPEAFSAAVMINLMKADKKAENSTPRFVLLDAIGRAHCEGRKYCFAVEPSLLEQTLDWMKNDFSDL